MPNWTIPPPPKAKPEKKFYLNLADPNEYTVQCELFHELRKAGVCCATECVFPLSWLKPDSLEPEVIRVDVVIHAHSSEAEGHLVLGGVEVKKGRWIKKEYIPSFERQRKKYNDWGLPYIYCMCREDIPQTVEWAVKLFNGALEWRPPL